MNAVTITELGANTYPLLDFWWRGIRWPAAAFLALATMLAFSNLDVAVAQTFFYDASKHTWVGAESWWINEVIHTGGRWLLRGVIVLGIFIWLASLLRRDLKDLRRPMVYFVLASILSVGVIGLLKTVTNVHCPWALEIFGANMPYLHLFDPRPATMHAGHCFPAAHASSGYALFALYFTLRERAPQLARASIVVALGCGLIFGFAQQSRGAHFVSHDLWSAFLVWLICLSVYTFGFRGSLSPLRVVANESMQRNRPVRMRRRFQLK